MSDLTQFSTLVALIALSAGFYAFLFNRLEGRINRLEDKLTGRADSLDKKFDDLRHDLAEEFRAQRGEVSAQVAAIAAAINAGRRG